ncbi:MAG: hypothetical protein RLZZ373_1432 [Pseudomonadota bacterium]|jgi:hypothetical protein
MHTRARLLMIAPLLSALLSAVLWILLSGSAARAALPDPTRPPAGLATANPGTLLLPRTATAMPTDPTVSGRPLRPVPAAALAVPRVQALHHPADAPPGSATALIDGRLLRTGDRLGDATVQEIRPDGVWLRLPRGGTQWLGLYAMVELPVTDPLTASATASEQTAPRKEP